MDGADFVERQLARQDNLLEAGVRQEAHLPGRAVVHLRRGMERDGRQVELEQPQVLHDERVGPCAVQLPRHLPGLLQLVVVEDGVESHVDPRAEEVGIRGEALDVGHGVSRGGPGAEPRPAYVDGVGAVADGLDARIGVARRGKEFNVSRSHYIICVATGASRPLLRQS